MTWTITSKKSSTTQAVCSDPSTARGRSPWSARSLSVISSVIARKCGSLVPEATTK